MKDASDQIAICMQLVMAVGRRPERALAPLAPSAQNAPRRASTLILLQHSQNPHRLPSTFALLHADADAVHDGRARAS